MDFGALRPSGRAKLAGGAVAIAGFWSLLLANQSHSIFRFHGVFALLIVFQFLSAAALIFCAMQTFKMRLWAVQGAVALSALICVTSAALLIYYLMNGVVSFMPMVVAPSTGASAVFAWLALSDAKKAQALREAMEEGGVDAGL